MTEKKSDLQTGMVIMKKLNKPRVETDLILQQQHNFLFTANTNFRRLQMLSLM